MSLLDRGGATEMAEVLANIAGACALMALAAFVIALLINLWRM